MWHIPAHHYSWPCYQLDILSPFATPTSARSRLRVKFRGTIIGGKTTMMPTGCFQYSIDLSPSRAVIRYRSNMSLHLASDYYLVNIDSQLAPALMCARGLHLRRTCRRRCLPSSALNRVISCKRCVAPSILAWLFTALSLNTIRLLALIHFSLL